MLGNTSLVFATLLTTSPDGLLDDYTLMTENFVKQLQCYNVPRDNILVLATSDVPAEARRKISRHGVHVRAVPPLSVNAGNARYRNTCSKIWLWKLTNWDRVVYYDSDMVFLQSPVACALKCPVGTNLCAVPDPVGTWPSPDPDYFNSGHMVLSPSRETFDWLKENIGKATGRQFGDQDMLNNMFRNNYTKVHKDCNFLHVLEDLPNFAVSRTSVVAVHEKLRRVTSSIPNKHFLRKCINFP